MKGQPHQRFGHGRRGSRRLQAPAAARPYERLTRWESPEFRAATLPRSVLHPFDKASQVPRRRPRHGRGQYAIAESVMAKQNTLRNQADRFCHRTPRLAIKFGTTANEFSKKTGMSLPYSPAWNFVAKALYG